MNLFAYAYCAIMVAGFLGAWKLLIKPLTDFGTDLEKTLAALPENLASGETIDGKAFNGTRLEPYWTRFTKEWSRSSHGGKGGIDRWSVVRPDEIFNFHDIASDLSNVKYIMAMPALMTGLGLLGTFTGLVLGISALDLSGSENLLLGIKTLLGGTKLAFSTSLTGILLALLWGHAERVTLHRISRDIRELCSRLNHRFPCLTQESILIKILGAVEAGPDLKPSIDALTERAGAYFDGASDANRRAVEAMVDSFIVSLNRSMRDQLSGLGDFLRGVEAWHGKTQAEFDRVTSRLEEVLSGFDGIVRKNGEAAKAVDRRLEAVSDLMDRSDRAWASAERTLAETSSISADASASIVRASEALKHSVIEFERVSREVSQTGPASIDRSRKLWDDTSSELARRISDAASPIAAALEHATTRMDGVRDSLGKQTADLARVAGALEKASSSFDTTVGAATKRYFDNFDSNIDEICSKIGRIAARTASTSEDLEKRLSELNSLLTSHVNRLDESLNGPAQDSSRSILERLGILRGKGR